MTRHRIYLVLAALVLIYAAMSLAIPPDPDALVKYRLSTLQLRFITVGLIIPVVAIWFAAVYGFIHLKEYSHLVRKSADGIAFNRISDGLGVVSLGLIVNQIASLPLAYYSRIHPGFLPTSRIIGVYVPLLFSVAGFILIYQGTELLFDAVAKFASWRKNNVVILGFLALAASYCYIIFTNPERQTAKIFALPDFLILLTVVIPYLYAWYCGILATIEMYQYQTRVKGVVYKSSVRLLSLGIGGVIAASLVVQFMTAISTIFIDFGLASLLLIIFILLIIISAGYILIAFGTKKLTKIEEV